jgi:ATP phosphoribosyltransferase regulatory subunit
MTPQVARIDAHLLNRQGVTRLCYCDSVLHTLPASQAASREPIQLGAELYGYAGIEADLEAIRLLADALTAPERRPHALTSGTSACSARLSSCCA